MKVVSIIKYLFFVIGLALLAGAGYLYQSKQTFLSQATQTEGVVVDLSLSRSDNSDVYYPVVTFQTQSGESVQFKASVGSNPPSYEEGEKVEVLYDPAAPKEAEINSFSSLYLAPLILGILGSVFFLIGFSIILYGYLKQKKAQYLLSNGMPLQTKIEQIAINTSIDINGRNPYQIISQWLEPSSQELYIFKSDNIWFDPSDYITSEMITVLIEVGNPKKYHMDISFLPKRKN